MFPNSKNRRGIAPLELVLALPLLAAVWVMMMYLGKAAIAKAQVTAEARRQTTSERFDVKDGKPLRFLENGLITGEEVTLTRQVDQKVNVSRFTRNLPTPVSEFTMQAGTWDHRQLPLNEAPSWDEIGTMAVSGGLSGLQDVMTEVQSIVSDPGDFASGAFGSLGGGGGNGGGGGSAPVPQGDKLDSSQSEVDRQKLRERARKADEKLKELEPQLRQARIDLLKLTAEEAGETVTLDADELRSVREQIVIEKNRIWRLERDIDYYRTERNEARAGANV